MKEFLALSSAEQDRLLDRLTDHAECKMRRLTWRGARIARGGSVPGGYESYDLALEAIAYALETEGSRWNRESFKTPESYLRSVIDSKISNLVNLSENKFERRMPVAPSGDGEVITLEIPGSEQDPLVLIIDKESRDKLRSDAMKELQGDGTLINIFECMHAEITKPMEIAETLSTKEKPVSQNDIYNATDRLARRLEKLDTRTKSPKKGKP